MNGPDHLDLSLPGNNLNLELNKKKTCWTSCVATYPSTGGRMHGSRHQRLFKENVRKTKKGSMNFEKKGSGVVYA